MEDLARCDSAVTLEVRAERARSFRVRRIGGRVSLKEISRTEVARYLPSYTDAAGAELLPTSSTVVSRVRHIG